MDINGQNDKAVKTSEDISKMKQWKTEAETLFVRLQLQGKLQQKFSPADFLTIGPPVNLDDPKSEKDLVYTFLKLLIVLNYRARYIPVGQDGSSPVPVFYTVDTDNNDLDALFSTSVQTVQLEQTHVHPMDVQMAAFHCSDSFLKQNMITKLSQCQYALPLLVPDPDSNDIECPLWTFRQINKAWKIIQTKDNTKTVTMKSMPMYKAKTPMVSFFRLGSLSVSKSQLINTLINDRHSTFFHRNCPGSTKSRIMMDGVAEIAWYCPAGKPSDAFTDCIAFCNLHGDALLIEKQREILTEKSSVNVVFVPTLERSNESTTVIKELFLSEKPLIILVGDNDCDTVQMKNRKYKIGLKDRSQSDVSEDLKKIIAKILSGPFKSFQLETMAEVSGITVDENDKVCQKGKSAAEKVMNLLQGMDVSKIKNKHLPCQGQLWHEWCRINKELYYLKGHIEKEKCKKEQELEQIRQNQCNNSCSELMKLFIKNLSSLPSTDKEYFLKWTQIIIDPLSSEDLSSILQSYDEKWSEVLELKRKHEKSDLKKKQIELERISNKLHSATFGLEHIFREMGQIYEAHKSLKKEPNNDQTDWSKYPALAAELMISGHPMELMDGDAGHVPLTWISSLLDEVIKKLGDQSVFVLSVLGLQSTGKSTMLNAMFGLQFAVSAGRCTRGAFMQLVKVSEEMKKDFVFDYVLVVDTEGLRALELAGNTTLHHDNELATFVVGLGNVTLINIFGENPGEMQDILQIVVQAFMRMKKVKLSPSCVFVHQNVTDVAAAEKNMDGKRRLQEKLDQMTKLIAKQEGCDTNRFTDVIAFNVQKDIKYFAQLWEGSPPMAPPNPCYSECVQDLKNFILSKASQSAEITLSQFKIRLQSLWNALMNENFVFSFKNTLEIAVYRKLEVQYGNWTWSLRSKMMTIENEFYPRSENGKHYKVELSDLFNEISETYGEIKKDMTTFFDDEKDKDILVQWKGQFETKLKEFHDEQVREMKRKLDDILQQWKAFKHLEEKKTEFENRLLQKNKELAQELKEKANNEQKLAKGIECKLIEIIKEIAQNLREKTKDKETLAKDFESKLTQLSKETALELRLKTQDGKEPAKQLKRKLIEQSNVLAQEFSDKANKKEELAKQCKTKLIQINKEISQEVSDKFKNEELSKLFESKLIEITNEITQDLEEQSKNDKVLTKWFETNMIQNMKKIVLEPQEKIKDNKEITNVVDNNLIQMSKELTQELRQQITDKQELAKQIESKFMQITTEFTQELRENTKDEKKLSKWFERKLKHKSKKIDQDSRTKTKDNEALPKDFRSKMMLRSTELIQEAKGNFKDIEEISFETKLIDISKEIVKELRKMTKQKEELAKRFETNLIHKSEELFLELRGEMKDEATSHNESNLILKSQEITKETREDTRNEVEFAKQFETKVIQTITNVTQESAQKLRENDKDNEELPNQTEGIMIKKSSKLAQDLRCKAKDGEELANRFETKLIQKSKEIVQEFRDKTTNEEELANWLETKLTEMSHEVTKELREKSNDDEEIPKNNLTQMSKDVAQEFRDKTKDEEELANDKDSKLTEMSNVLDLRKQIQDEEEIAKWFETNLIQMSKSIAQEIGEKFKDEESSNQFENKLIQMSKEIAQEIREKTKDDKQILEDFDSKLTQMNKELTQKLREQVKDETGLAKWFETSFIQNIKEITQTSIEKAKDEEILNMFYNKLIQMDKEIALELRVKTKDDEEIAQLVQSKMIQISKEIAQDSKESYKDKNKLAKDCESKLMIMRVEHTDKLREKIIDNEEIAKSFESMLTEKSKVIAQELRQKTKEDEEFRKRFEINLTNKSKELTKELIEKNEKELGKQFESKLSTAIAQELREKTKYKEKLAKIIETEFIQISKVLSQELREKMKDNEKLAKQTESKLTQMSNQFNQEIQENIKDEEECAKLFETKLMQSIKKIAQESREKIKDYEEISNHFDNKLKDMSKKFTQELGQKIIAKEEQIESKIIEKGNQIALELTEKVKWFRKLFTQKTKGAVAKDFKSKLIEMSKELAQDVREKPKDEDIPKWFESNLIRISKEILQKLREMTKHEKEFVCEFENELIQKSKEFSQELREKVKDKEEAAKRVERNLIQKSKELTQDLQEKIKNEEELAKRFETKLIQISKEITQDLRDIKDGGEPAKQFQTKLIQNSKKFAQESQENTKDEEEIVKQFECRMIEMSKEFTQELREKAEEVGKIAKKLESKMKQIGEEYIQELREKAEDDEDLLKKSESKLIGKGNEITQILREITKDEEEVLKNFESKLILMSKDILQEFGDKTKAEKELVTEFESRMIQMIQEITQELSVKSRDIETFTVESKMILKSKEIAQVLMVKTEEEFQIQFNSIWNVWMNEIMKEMQPVEDINLKKDKLTVLQELGVENEFIHSKKLKGTDEHIPDIKDYSEYVDKHRMLGIIPKHRKTLPHEEQELIRSFIDKVEKQSMDTFRSKPVATTGYRPTYLQEVSKSIKEKVTEFELQRKYTLKKKFTVDLLLYVFDRAESWILDSHKKFRMKNDPHIYFENKKDHYYNIFRCVCREASSAVVLGELICEKLKVSTAESICNKTAIDLAGEMRCSFPAFSGNRLNLEKHVLTSLAEKEDFDGFMNYIKHPRKHVESFIKQEVKKYIFTDNEDKALNILKKNVEDMNKLVNQALFTTTEKVKAQRGDTEMWLEEFSSQLKDQLKFDTISSQNFSDINDFDLLKKEIEAGLVSIIEKISSLSLEMMKDFRLQPDQILIDQLCSCCWVQCPFCAAVCTNSLEDHDGDHSVPFHRSHAVNGLHHIGIEELDVDFCTTKVASDGSFHPHGTSDDFIPFKKYRSVGLDYANWNITPNESTPTYWKWFVCRFQKNLEDHYNRRFQGRGEIPKKWRKFSKEEAIKSLEELSE